MAAKHILVVDDEEDILELVEYNLVKQGYTVSSVRSGEECLDSIKETIPDLIILDLMLPGRSGLEICSLLKNNYKLSRIPIVMLTAKGEESDIVAGLEMGADDYITKPFIPRILGARVRAVLRRQALQDTDNSPENLRFDGLVIDQAKHIVEAEGLAIELTATEFKLLLSLAKQPGRVFTRTQIVKAVHGADYPVTDRSIDVQIVGLRRKLGGCCDLIETVRGVGYRFKDLQGSKS